MHASEYIRTACFNRFFPQFNATWLCVCVLVFLLSGSYGSYEVECTCACMFSSSFYLSPFPLSLSFNYNLLITVNQWPSYRNIHPHTAQCTFLKLFFFKRRYVHFIHHSCALYSYCVNCIRIMITSAWLALIFRIKDVGIISLICRRCHYYLLLYCEHTKNEHS